MEMNGAEVGRGVAWFQQAWTAPKAGHEEGQNEDAWHTTLSQGGGGCTLLVAVADGATEAVYSRLWARALVEAAAPDWPALGDDELNARLSEVRAAFKPFAEGQELPWYVQTKWLTVGSQATLLVATIAGTRGADEVEVRAVAVGDSCLLLFRQGAPQPLSFPVESADGFGAHPALVRNRFRDALEFRRLPPTPMQPGDLLLACTDAVGKWALKCVESGQTQLVFDALLELLAAEPEAVHNAAAEAAGAAATEAANEASNEASAEAARQEAARQEAAVGREAAARQIVIPVVKSEPPPRPARLTPRWKVAQVVQKWWPKVFGPPDTELRSPTPEPAADRPAPGADDHVERATEAPPATDGPPANSEPPVSDQPPATRESEEPARPKFEQFIARCRAPDAEPRMGNDDSTLVLCVLLPGAGDGQRGEALKVMRGYRDAAGQPRTAAGGVA